MAYKYDSGRLLVSAMDVDVSLKDIVPSLFKNVKISNDFAIEIITDDSSGDGVGVRFVAVPDNMLEQTPNISKDITYPRYYLTKQRGHICIQNLMLMDILVTGPGVIGLGTGNVMIQVIMVGP